MKKTIQIIVVLSALVLTAYAVVEYWDEFRMKFFTPEGQVVVYVGNTPFGVTVADTPATRKQGLSGTKELGQFEGKLFIFDTAAKHGIWMKDMNYPIDILWFDESFSLVHFETEVSPDTYPKVFAPTTDAKYVMEIHSNTVKSLPIKLGERLLIPASFLPAN